MRLPWRRPCAVTRRMFGEDEEVWGVVALLHDFDYEQYPELKDHPFRGAEILRERGCPEFVIRAILSHGEHTNTPRESKLEHALFACDEMAGFVTAAALVRPSKSVRDLEAGLGDEADERQSVCQGRQPRRSAEGRGRAGPSARGAHRQRHRVHARTRDVLGF